MKLSLHDGRGDHCNQQEVTFPLCGGLNVGLCCDPPAESHRTVDGRFSTLTLQKLDGIIVFHVRCHFSIKANGLLTSLCAHVA